MKINTSLKTILKNFSSINSNFFYKKESGVIRTRNAAGTVFATYDGPEVNDIKTDVKIYDFSEFLDILTVFKDPEIDFNSDTSCTIKGDGAECTYVFADESLLVKADKDIKMPAFDVAFFLSKEDLNTVIKAAGVLSLPVISFENKKNKIVVSAVNSSNNSANKFNLEVGDYDGINSFSYHVKVENLIMINMDYQVEISSAGIIRFYNKDNHLNYYSGVQVAS